MGSMQCLLGALLPTYLSAVRSRRDLVRVFRHDGRRGTEVRLAELFAGEAREDRGLPDWPTPDGEVGRSVRQVAKLLGVCRATVCRLCERGELPHDRVLNAIRVDPVDVRRFLAKVRR